MVDSPVILDISLNLREASPHLLNTASFLVCGELTQKLIGQSSVGCCLTGLAGISVEAEVAVNRRNRGLVLTSAPGIDT
jgi:hypothetical protein